MGLDFDKSEAHWSYSGFHQFRRRLAATIGVNLDSMQGFGDLSAVIGKTQGARPISWATVNDPIAPLLYHSDCDENLSPEECETVGSRLRELVSFWPDDRHKRQALLLAEGMDACVRDGEPLEFC